MPEIKLQSAWRVDIIESERDWGQKTIESKYFDNEAEAKQFVKDFNAQNTSATVPDWYMMADGPYKVK